jgi:PAS domain S-box-containing protein
VTESDSLPLTTPDETVPDVSVAIQQFGNGKQQVESRLREREARFQSLAHEIMCSLAAAQGFMANVRQIPSAVFRSIADSAPVLIWMAGTDKKRFYFNQPWLAFTGRALEQELGDGWAEGVHPDDWARCLEAYGTHFEARAPIEVEYRLRRHDGEYRWVLDRGRPQFTPAGEFEGYVGSAIDVTDLKRTDQALQASERRYRALFEKANDAIFLETEDDDIVAVNQRACDLLGYSRAELLAMKVSDLQAPEVRGIPGAVIKGELGRHQDNPFEALDVHRDGRRIPVEITNAAIEEDGKRLVLSIVRDVSERRRLLEELEERLRFETVLADLSARFINLPADEIDAQIEQSLRTIVEYLEVDRGGLAEVLSDPKQLVLTHSYHVPGPPPDTHTILDEQLPWYTRTIYQGEILRFSALPADLPPDAVMEREYCLHVGLKAHVMIPLKVMGAVVGAIGFGSFCRYRDWPDDLVQRLRLVGEIFTYALARKGADAALRAREQSLRQAREGLRKLAAKLLHAQEEERRRIAREMHDDWTQRLALLGIDIAKLEKHIGVPERALPLLRTMQEQLMSLSEDVHDLSRQLHPSILDDVGLVEALRSECASFSRRERIEVVYRPEAVLPTLPKDAPLCVYRVAQEALRNLAKHAAVNEAWVTLVATGPELLLRVQDKGVGFDPAGMHSQPGLGLSSMEERVRLIQGKLSVTSAPGRGTTVEVRVPLVRSDP